MRVERISFRVNLNIETVKIEAIQWRIELVSERNRHFSVRRLIQSEKEIGNDISLPVSS